MPTIGVRVSEEQKRGCSSTEVSPSSIREALSPYIDTKKSQELIRKLEDLQRSDRVETTAACDVSMKGGQKR
jgi:hypothetical protein